MTLHELATRWTDEAASLAKWGDDRGSALLRVILPDGVQQINRSKK